jgi:hypothetical protein
MKYDYKYFWPVKVAGAFFLIIGIIAGMLYLYNINNPKMDLPFQIFILVNFIWYLLMGLGLIKQWIWGYNMLKFYLYIISIGFPIGTYIGIKSLRYLKENNIKYFFEQQAIDL